MIKPTFKANFDSGEGSIGNLEKFREAHDGLMRADLLKDWIYFLEIEYQQALDDMNIEFARLAKKRMKDESDSQRT
jgi:hypothetical protein